MDIPVFQYEFSWFDLLEADPIRGQRRCQNGKGRDKSQSQ
jgi:hypothetical protein